MTAPRVSPAALVVETGETRATTPVPDEVLRARVRGAVGVGVRPALTARRLGAVVALYLVASAVGLSAGRLVGRWSAVVWVAVWCAQALLLVATGAVVHEAAHVHLTGVRGVDAVLGHLAGAVVFLPFVAYRSYHLGHHVDTCGPADPEGEPYAFTSRRRYLAAVVLGGWLFVIGLTVAMVCSVIGRPPPFVRTRAQRQAMVDGVLVWLATAIALAGSLVVAPRVAVTCWLVPVALLLSGPLSLLLLPEHLGAAGPGPKVANTRTCRSTRVVRWVFLNANFHTVHHIAVMVPWHDLPRAHDLIASDVVDGWDRAGYGRFHRDVWRSVGRAEVS